jgi:hypothetical protein
LWVSTLRIDSLLGKRRQDQPSHLQLSKLNGSREAKLPNSMETKTLRHCPPR